MHVRRDSSVAGGLGIIAIARVLRSLCGVGQSEVVAAAIVG